LRLWDREMAPDKPRLEPLTSAERLKLVVSAIDWALGTLPRPTRTESVRGWLENALSACRAAVEGGEERVTLPGELDDSYENVEEDADELGTSHFLSAITACCGAPEGMTCDVTYGILSFRYEGSFDREGIPGWTLDAERANPRCVEVIGYQKDLIDRATA
jgi:hypothetical protein